MKDEFLKHIGKCMYESCWCMVGSAVGRGMIQTCEACGGHNLRFIHTAENMETGETFYVGQDCATVLVSAEEHELPRLAENEVKRKERWRVFYKKPGRCIVTTEDLEARGKL